eukprot:Gb_29391 [translate_table: standard]
MRENEQYYGGSMVSSMEAETEGRDWAGAEEVEALGEALHCQRQRQRREVKKELGSSLQQTLSSFPASKSHLKPPPTKGIHRRSLWDWKPLRALSHIRHQRFLCLFSLHVHTIEGLPPTLNGFTLTTHWRRREGDVGAHTKPATVFHGVAGFEETLYHKCTVYGTKSSPDEGMKYESKYFDLSVGMGMGAQVVDCGKYRLDLSRMLPHTIDDCGVEDKCGSWATNFKLTGKAKGGILVVTLGYKILNKEFGQIGEKKPKPSTSTRATAKTISSNTRVMNPKSTQNFNNAVRGTESVEAASEARADHERVSNLSLDDGESMDQLSSLLDFKPKLKYFDEDDGGSLEEDVEFIVVEQGVEMGNNDGLEEDLRVDGPGVQDSCFLGHCKGSDHMDDTDSVTGEFLSRLDIGDQNPVGFGSDSDPDSPRARLLKQFERESVLEGGLGIGKGAEGEPSHSSALQTRFSWESDEDLELASIVQAAETELQKATQTMRSKTRAKMLEDAETEALMQEWGMNERAFRNSPPGSSSSFPLEEPLELPALAEGLGSLIKTKDGGLLRSMNPALFRNSKNNGTLVMHVSNPLVVPAEMGSSVMDILRRLASVGIEKLSVQARRAMPLEDITGKTIEQVALEAVPLLEGTKNRQSTLQGPEVDKRSECQSVQLPDSRRVCVSDCMSQRKASTSRPKLSSTADIKAEYVSLDELAPLAMEKIEALSIEGLKIQSDMADQEAPSNVSATSWGEVAALEGTRAKKFGTLGLEGTAGLQLLDTKEASDNTDGLLGMTITLDEWIKLDAGIINEEEKSDRISNILAAHRAVRSDFITRGFSEADKGEKGRQKHGTGRWGYMGNTLTIALLIQLRDPLRNFEPVGAPMMALVQAERVVVPARTNMWRRVSEKGNGEEVEETEPEDKKEELSQFKITDVHVAGLKSEEDDKKKGWTNPKQQQSGSRWLIASGMGKSGKHPMLKSKPVAKPMPPSKTKVKPGETLWSISSRIHGSGGKWKEVAALNPHIRNPDIIFPNDTIRLH